MQNISILLRDAIKSISILLRDAIKSISILLRDSKYINPIKGCKIYQSY